MTGKLAQKYADTAPSANEIYYYNNLQSIIYFSGIVSTSGIISGKLPRAPASASKFVLNFPGYFAVRFCISNKLKLFKAMMPGLLTTPVAKLYP